METDTTSPTLPLLKLQNPMELWLPRPHVAPAPIRAQLPEPQIESVTEQAGSLSALLCQEYRRNKAEGWLFAAIAVTAGAGIAWGVWDSLALTQNWAAFEHLIGQLTR